MFQNLIKNDDGYVELLFIEDFKSGFNVSFKLVFINWNIVFGQIICEQNWTLEGLIIKRWEVFKSYFINKTFTPLFLFFQN